VLGLEKNVAGSNSAKAMDFLRAIKIRSTPIGWEVKPEVLYRNILLHVKELSKSHGD
jgi:hypothetical protein